MDKREWRARLRWGKNARSNHYKFRYYQILRGTKSGREGERIDVGERSFVKIKCKKLHKSDLVRFQFLSKRNTHTQRHKARERVSK